MIKQITQESWIMNKESHEKYSERKTLMLFRIQFVSTISWILHYDSILMTPHEPSRLVETWSAFFFNSFSSITSRTFCYICFLQLFKMIVFEALYSSHILLEFYHKNQRALLDKFSIRNLGEKRHPMELNVLKVKGSRMIKDWLLKSGYLVCISVFITISYLYLDTVKKLRATVSSAVIRMAFVIHCNTKTGKYLNIVEYLILYMRWTISTIS